ncbi:MAG: hypothetical protein ACRCWQ_05160 [Bacilli bacterium]
MADQIIGQLKELFAAHPPFGSLLGRDFTKVEQKKTATSVDEFRRYMDSFHAFGGKYEARELLGKLKEELSK